MKKPTEITIPDIDPKPYLDYMDKEMTLCGIITTFSLACVLFMVDKIFSSIKKDDATIQIDFKSIYFLTALILLVGAAYLLFKLRADLAYNYGQISLEITSKGFTGRSIQSYLKHVDSWRFWYPYFWGINLIVSAFFQIAIFLLINFYKISLENYWSLIVLVVCIICGYIRIRYYEIEDSEDTNLPHAKVYTRIAVSKIPEAGVGLFAIRDIPKDEYIFFPDDDEMIWVDINKIESLPIEIKKLYEDFCVKKGNQYGCPINFNKLTPAWYLNNSNKPNVYVDDDYRFKAIKDIKKGEELTSRYSLYSDSSDFEK